MARILAARDNRDIKRLALWPDMVKLLEQIYDSNTHTDGIRELEARIGNPRNESVNGFLSRRVARLIARISKIEA